MYLLKTLLPFLLFSSALLVEATQIHYIKIKGTINPGSADYIVSKVKLANDQGAGALAIELDTPGGLLSSTRQIIQAINQSSVPVVVVVTPSGSSATSAGALIALSANWVAMEEGTNIGAAHPVASGGQTIEGTMGDKVTEDTSALARAQAQLHGRNSEVAAKMVTQSLSLSADEALAKNIANQVLKAGLERPLEAIAWEKVIKNWKVQPIQWIYQPMDLKHQLLHTIADPNISTLLLSLGGLAIYTEISAGFTLIAPGVIGVFLLILGFISLQMLPITTGGGVLVLLGLSLLVAEIFVTSFGLLAIAGTICLFLGSLFLVDPLALNLTVSMSLMVNLFGAILLIIGFLGWRFYQDSRVSVKSGIEAMIGQSATILSGSTLQYQGEIWNYESTEAYPIDHTVTLISFDGLVWKVKPS
jgi:membrane-bound serine protease (ClpP class)